MNPQHFYQDLGVSHPKNAVSVFMETTLVMFTSTNELIVPTEELGVEYAPAVAMNANGNSVVVWDADDNVYARQYGPDLVPLGDAFQVNASPIIQGNERPQENADVAIATDGSFVIVWQSLLQDGDSEGIYAQRYGANGNPIGSQFRVNTYTEGMQRKPAIAMEPDGDSFVITWETFDDRGEFDIYAQRYSANGTPLGTEFHVSNYDGGFFENPDVAIDNQGNFVITYEGNRVPGEENLNIDGNNIHARTFDSTGAGGIAFRVNTDTDESQLDPSIGMNADGDFVIAWEAYDSEGQFSFQRSRAIHAQRYGTGGTPLGNEFRVNTTTADDQINPAVSIASDDSFVVVWQSGDELSNEDGQDGEDGGIFAQRFTPAGQPLEGEFQVNQYTIGNQDDPAIAFGADDTFTIAWAHLESGRSTIYRRVYGDDVIDPPILGSDSNDTVAGTDADDQIFAGPGDDTFLPSGGSDFLDGEGGIDVVDCRTITVGVTVNLSRGTAVAQGLGKTDTLANIENVIGTSQKDKLTGDRANNELSGGGGADSIKGGDGNDSLLGEGGKDKVWGGKGNDALLGGGGGDKLKGGDGNDEISGGGGKDTIWGDRGKDTLTGGGSKDVFVVKAKGGLDTITDLSIKQDRIDLKGKLKFDDLSFSQRQDDVLVKAKGQNLLVIEGVDIEALTSKVFI